MARKLGPMQKAAEAQAKKADQACAGCGRTDETLASMEVNGKETKFYCPKCMMNAADVKAACETVVESAIGKPVDDERREVTEVRYKPKDRLVRIGYDEPHGQDIHNIILESKDAPKAAFVAALQALATHAATICEMEDPDWIEGVTVLGVKMKPRRSGFGAVISCVKKLQSHAVMCFNTPFLPESAEHGPTLPPVVVKCLNLLMAEALAYVDGTRAQGELFEDAAE